MKSLDGKNILVAADTRDSLLMCRLLPQENITVDCAENLKSAEALLEKRQYDLIAICIYFDNAQVFRLLNLIRASELNRQSIVLCYRPTPAILQSICDRSTQMALQVMGANHFLDISLSIDHQAHDDLSEKLCELIVG